MGERNIIRIIAPNLEPRFNKSQGSQTDQGRHEQMSTHRVNVWRCKVCIHPRNPGARLTLMSALSFKLAVGNLAFWPPGTHVLDCLFGAYFTGSSGRQVHVGSGCVFAKFLSSGGAPGAHSSSAGVWTSRLVASNSSEPSTLSKQCT